jgi:foldase protein PrsA
VGAKSGQSKKSVGFNRLALIIFGALFGALFVGFAVAQGIGQPSVPSGDVALVQGVSDGNISEAEFKLGLRQQIAGGKLKTAPKPGSKKYEELKKTVVNELLESTWIRGEAEEKGLAVTPKQIATKLAVIKKESFPTPAAYAEFLKTSHFTQEDVDKRVELSLLSEEVQNRIKTEAPTVSKSEISAFYDASKSTQFTTKASRDIRLVVNKNKAQVEAAKAALDKDNSPASWKKVAAKYSSDPTTKTKGGLQAGITEEFLEEPLKAAIFKAATGEVVGPVTYQKNYLVFQVEKLNSEKVQSFAEVKSQISTQLAEQVQQEFFTEFVAGFSSKWESRTFCAAGFAIEKCSNFKSSGHPSTAPAACYEANPKKPATECPAPVELTKPALPGTTTILKPQGERLVQRANPGGLKESVTETTTTAPEGAPTETGE